MPNIRDQVKARDTHCWHCGTTDDLQVHHRQNRGMGGRGKLLDRTDNLVLVCAAYNYAMESNAEVAKLARERGHKLGSWDGFDTPILDVPTGIWFILTSDGRKVKGLPRHFRN